MTAPRETVFASSEDKARWLDAQATIDASSARLGAFARELARRSPNPAATFFSLARDGIRYVPDLDPHGRRAEVLADSLTILRRGSDDCDGKVRLFVALCRAVGLHARVVPVYAGDRFVHVQAEVHGVPGWAPTEDDGWTRVELTVDGWAPGMRLADFRRADGTYPKSGWGPRWREWRGETVRGLVAAQKAAP